MTYSANNELKEFAKKLGFKLYIFDDIEKSTNKLRDKTKNGEIDAILKYRNILFLVGINKGTSENVKREAKKFFDKLDKTNSYTELNSNLHLENNSGDLEKTLKRIKDSLRSLASKDYEIIIKKLFFAPNKEIESDYTNQYNEIIIDKDIFEYFSEVSKALNNDMLRNDFLYLTKIKKIDFDKKDSSKTYKPGKSGSYKVDRLELDTQKRMIMYSLSIRVEDIKNYVTVLRLANKYDKRGFQRMINSNRLEKINRDYLKKNKTFPNNIIILLSPEVYKDEKEFYNEEKNELSFLDEFNSLIIIDGQHRFFSFIKGNKEERQILISLIFLKYNKKLQAEKMFYEINKEQKRIDPNLDFELKAKIDGNSEESFWYQVFNKLIKVGFLKGRFTFKETILRKKSNKKSIVSVIKYGGILSLNKGYNKNKIKVDGFNTFYSKKREKNVEIAFEIIKNYFDIIEKVLTKQNFNKKELSPLEIGALLRLLKHFMLNDKDKIKILSYNNNILKKCNSDDEKIKQTIDYFEYNLSCIDFNQISAQQLSASNWGAIEGYMLKQINKKNTNFGNSNLLSKKGKEIYDKT